MKKIHGGESIAIQDDETSQMIHRASLQVLELSGERTTLIIEIMARTKSMRSEETVWNLCAPSSIRSGDTLFVFLR